MPLDLQIGRRFQAIDQQFGLAGQRNGEQALAVAVEHVVEELHVGVFAEKHRQAPAGRDVLLQGGDRRGVEPLDIRQVDGPKIGQRLEAQVARRLDLRANAGRGPARPAPAQCSAAGRRGPAASPSTSSTGTSGGTSTVA